MQLEVTRRYSLSALHVLSGEGFSREENLRVFGGCSVLHGHEYLVEVTVAGPIDASTGLVIGRDELDRIVRERLLDPLTGCNLSDHFRHTTGEALAGEFFALLQSEIHPPALLERVLIRETAKNSFEFSRGHWKDQTAFS